MRAVFALLLCPLLAASAVAQPGGETLDRQLKQARAEQAAAERETARLEKAVSEARSEAERLRAEQAAAARAIEAAEARITVADTQARFAAASVAAHRQRLAQEQRPVSSLLAGLAVMGRRPPILALADEGSTDELVKVRILLDSTLPVIRARTGRLSARLAEGQRLQQAALDSRAEMLRSRQDLMAKREKFAALERTALQRALTAGGQALSAGDVAIAAGEDIERLRGGEAASRSAAALAAQLASEGPAPPRPFAPEGALPRPTFAYELPAAAPVIEGLASVNAGGIRSRGLTLATRRGWPLTAPADGVVRFSGPFRSHDGVLILDHGKGWMTLIVNAASELRPGARVGAGEPLGRALGPIQLELSQNGRRISPALIAGSSRSLSKGPKGG